jgi:hypothetical protein
MDCNQTFFGKGLQKSLDQVWGLGLEKFGSNLWKSWIGVWVWKSTMVDRDRPDRHTAWLARSTRSIDHADRLLVDTVLDPKVDLNFEVSFGWGWVGIGIDPTGRSGLPIGPVGSTQSGPKSWVTF